MSQLPEAQQQNVYEYMYVDSMRSSWRDTISAFKEHDFSTMKENLQEMQQKNSDYINAGILHHAQQEGLLNEAEYSSVKTDLANLARSYQKEAREAPEVTEVYKESVVLSTLRQHERETWRDDIHNTTKAMVTRLKEGSK